MTIITPSMEGHAQWMKRHAATGTFDGKTADLYFHRAKHLHTPTGTLLLYTRDVGHHTSGWWKNPDYERCLHLSMSFWDVEAGVARPFDTALAKAWVVAFFGEWRRYIWEESQTTPHLPAEVRHFRVFCDPVWQPIIPRGEVYSRELTEAGWLSWSDARYAEKKVQGE